MPYSDFLTLAKARFSVRSFSQKPVEAAVIARILEAGQIAPTACNNQPQRIFVLQSDPARRALEGCTRWHFHAPLALLVCYDRTKSWTRRSDGTDSGPVDASIVTTHMMLEAWEYGVGSTWVMSFDPQAVRKAFSLSEDLIPVSILVMGYPSEDCQPNPLHFKKKELDETVTFL